MSETLPAAFGPPTKPPAPPAPVSRPLSAAKRRPSDPLQGLLQIPDEVLVVLYSDGKPHQVVADSAQLLVLGGEAGVRHRCGMLRQGLGRAERDREAEHLQVVQERKRLPLAATDIERDQRTGPRVLLAVDRVFGVVRRQQPD